jgi:hypothetical protein
MAVKAADAKPMHARLCSSMGCFGSGMVLTLLVTVLLLWHGVDPAGDCSAVLPPALLLFRPPWCLTLLRWTGLTRPDPWFDVHGPYSFVGPRDSGVLRHMHCMSKNTTTPHPVTPPRHTILPKHRSCTSCVTEFPTC